MKKLGILSGKILLFGGVYSNLQALEALMEVAKQMKIPSHNVICTGDIIGYCAQPEEVSELMRKSNFHTIAGNVEQQLRNDQQDCGCDFDEGTTCDMLSKTWYPFAQKHISNETKTWLSEIPLNLSFEYAGKTCTVVHGSYTNISEFIFQSTSWEIKEQNFNKTKSDLIIAGHCGLPFLEANDNKLWINPGVIGMPANDGNTEVWFAVLEEMDGTINVTHHQLVYDFELAAQLMEQANLPREYSLTLKTGIWDNCDILPETETNNQGKKIVI